MSRNIQKASLGGSCCGRFHCCVFTKIALSIFVAQASYPLPSEHANERMDPECLIFHGQSLLTKASDIWLERKGTMMTPFTDPKK